MKNIVNYADGMNFGHQLFFYESYEVDEATGDRYYYNCKLKKEFHNLEAGDIFSCICISLHYSFIVFDKEDGSQPYRFSLLLNTSTTSPIDFGDGQFKIVKKVESKKRSFWDKIKCLFGHSWEYTANEEYDSAQNARLGITSKEAERRCTRCGTVQRQSVHLLGLNPPDYIREWYTVKK